MSELFRGIKYLLITIIAYFAGKRKQESDAIVDTINEKVETIEKEKKNVTKEEVYDASNW